MSIPLTGLRRVYRDAPTRDANWPTPVFGAHCVLQNTGEALTYLGPLYGWRPPWNSEWGIVGKATLPIGSFVNPATDFTLLDFVNSPVKARFTKLDNRNYEVEVRTQVYTLGGAANLVEVVAAWFPRGTNEHVGTWDDFTSRPTVAGYVDTQVDSSGAIESVTLSRRFGPNENRQIPRGQGEFSLALVQGIGSGAFATSDYRFDTSITVRDIGPSGNPVQP